MAGLDAQDTQDGAVEALGGCKVRHGDRDMVEHQSEATVVRSFLALWERRRGLAGTGAVRRGVLSPRYLGARSSSSTSVSASSSRWGPSSWRGRDAHSAGSSRQPWTSPVKRGTL